MTLLLYYNEKCYKGDAMLCKCFMNTLFFSPSFVIAKALTLKVQQTAFSIFFCFFKKLKKFQETSQKCICLLQITISILLYTYYKEIKKDISFQSSASNGLMDKSNIILNFCTLRIKCFELTLCLLGTFSEFFVLCCFFSKSTFSSMCQTVWIQIRPDILSGLIWVQTVCKGYQQTTLVGKELMMWKEFGVRNMVLLQ